MKKYIVTMPIAGSVTIVIEANSEEEAIELALEFDGEEDDITWEKYENLVEGNVFLGEISEVQVEEIEDDEDEDESSFEDEDEDYDEEDFEDEDDEELNETSDLEK